MNKQHGKRTRGYTVIELMIVLVILAILVALAYPSFAKYVRKANRGEAQQLLMNWAVNQEIWRSNNLTYADENDIAVPTNPRYVFTVTGESATAYLLTATATSSDQQKDESRDGLTPCTPLTLNQSGTKLPAVCWD
jgi:type IV pilus assembly protein PilE